MRGKAGISGGKTGSCGITPACAGKSYVENTPMTYFEDHPRVCGEKEFLVTDFVQEIGSPPRVRGKALPMAEDSSATGITPACAGKRQNLIYHEKGSEDHPRVCGEKCSRPALNCVAGGSPPRVRGKVHDSVTSVRDGRITPACAWKSMKIRRSYRS